MEFFTAIGVASHAQDAGNLFRTTAEPAEIHTSNFVGKRIYSTETAIAGDAFEGVQADWQDIGEINDVILSRDGTIDAVLVDIGGFLGMGERHVAVDMSAIHFVVDTKTPHDESDYFLVMNAPRAALEAAPEYTWKSTGAATDTTASMTPRTPVTRDGYATAADQDLTTEMLTSAAVYDANDKEIGTVSKLIITDDGNITDAIVDVGGFLGMSEKPVELKIGDLDILRATDGKDLRVYVSMTKEQLEAMPTYSN